MVHEAFGKLYSKAVCLKTIQFINSLTTRPTNSLSFNFLCRELNSAILTAKENESKAKENSKPLFCNISLPVLKAEEYCKTTIYAAWIS